MNATRFHLPPLPQPQYRFRDVPPAKRDLSGSTLHRVDDREQWQASLGEMVLICKEAVRRRREKTGAAFGTTASKPLSLEYLADRSDVDDPMWGYMVRDADGQRLQGFVTVTTFTNYHKSFCWDSLHPVAFEEDDAEDDADESNTNSDTTTTTTSKTAQRAIDSNGRLAQELQGLVRAGDIWQEGIVWPRVAEISLLGGLGCGRTLLELVLEELTHATPTPLAHYDYVVLQATDNSIPFYESLGFIRVGALTTEANAAHAAGLASPRRHHTQHTSISTPQSQTTKSTSGNDDGDMLDHDWGSPMATSKQKAKTTKVSSYKTVESAEPSDWVVGPATEQYVVKKAGETPLKIAQNLRINPYDIVFLNLRVFPELTVNSRLKAQTTLTLPKVLPSQTSRQRTQVEIQWYTANENDTPRSIAKLFQVPCAQIVAANKVRLPGLLSASRLKQGTKVRISQADDYWQAYSHWAFPDDDFEEGEPSYMMALKLQKPKKRTNARPVLQSLATEITPYQRPHVLQDVVPASNTTGTATTPSTPAPQAPPVRPVVPETPSAPTNEMVSPVVQDSLHMVTSAPPAAFPPPPVPPKRPPAAFLLFCNDMRQRKAALLAGKNAGQAARILKDAYELTSDVEKHAYIDKACAMRQEFVALKAEYEKRLAIYHQTYPHAIILTTPANNHNSTSGLTAAANKKNNSLLDTHMAVTSPAQPDLFNKVVRLRSGAPDADGTLEPYTYWYVLTYIPDLQWCHLAPMVAVGTFGPDKPKAAGRPKYKLEDEALGLEVDISSAYCIAVKAKSMRHTVDADKEEWDVRDNGTEPVSVSRRTSLASQLSMDGSVSSSLVRTAAIKPSVLAKDRKRKRSPSEITTASTTTTPSAHPILEAILPGEDKTVRLLVRQRGPGRPLKKVAMGSESPQRVRQQSVRGKSPVKY
eukprot:scaffold34924_cov125-Amphora_coffeaeformis.AAC.2